MRNGWTGGQYSLFRAVFATCLLIHFLSLLSWGADSPVMRVALLIAGAALCVLFGIGLYDRAAALGIGVIWMCLLDRDALRNDPTNLIVAGLLLLHVLLPPAAYGSWAARGRVDPGGGWRVPPRIFAAAWVALALSYGYSGGAKLGPPWHDGTDLTRAVELPSWLSDLAEGTVLALELLFWPLALVPRLRPWLWTAMLLIHLPLVALIDFADRSLGLVMLHLFAFDPGWIRPRGGATEQLFYDGHCGLCQRSVRLILAEDTTESAFRFAPLQGETFAAVVSEAERAKLPMSMVVRTERGELLTRSAGVLHILRRLGGIWRLMAALLALLPARLRDAMYDGVARIRHRIFAQPAEACPLMPPRLRKRFDP